MISFQEMVARLTQFWTSQGCIAWQGHDLETGAATFNPATFLRALGPEPFNAVYVEPVRRPQDGRYGQNPNRIFLFHQLQMIMKPSPPNIQELYLKSLEAVGLNLKEHDIRFVHDDWEAPTQGAWGLGWEVWIDGMEATQFTYFQAIGGMQLKPITVELAYGLERLAMYIQNVDNIFDVKWNDELTLGDLSQQNEIQWSAYNFEQANTKMWKRHFEDFEKEAQTLIENHLPIPAADFVIKASHAFNMLDSRGVISPTERTGYIAKVRDLSAQIADSYLDLRQKLNFPLLKEKITPFTPALPKNEKVEKNTDKKVDFLLEIGSEELPAHYITAGSNSLKILMEALLKEHGIDHGPIKVTGTPRRLVLHVEEMAYMTQEKQVEKRGPALNSAFGSDGEPTLQGRGFLKSIGLESASIGDIKKGKVPEIEIRHIKGHDYLLANLTQPGLLVSEILTTHLPKLIAKVHFPKKMRWGCNDIEYPRPIHWIVCLLGKRVVPFAFGPILAGRETRGHSQLDPLPFSIKEPSEYFDTLKKHHVIADEKERQDLIAEQLAAIEKELGGTALRKERLIPELCQLSEWPQLASATFDEKFLRAPKEVLISEMAQHQRYFPLIDATGKLMHHFVITADNSPSTMIIRGNQKVISARLSDGLFLYDQDRKISLEAMNKRLESIVFQKDLGSMHDKVVRLERHAALIANTLQITEPEKAKRAAHLCKADLASLLVNEFPELQGTIGKDYALGQKEDPEIATAIEEHWMPRQEGAPLPASPLGRVLSLADRIDNLLGYFSVGLKPTSSSDPYACRRTAIGIIKILIDSQTSVNLESLLKEASHHFERMPQNTASDVLDYITARAKGVFEERGLKKDEIEAALMGRCIDPYDQFRRIKALAEFRHSEHFGHLFEVYKRVKGQLAIPVLAKIDPSLFQDASEEGLYAHVCEIQPEYETALETFDYKKVFDLLASLRPYLSELFNQVKVLDDNLAIQKNRLALLQSVFSFFERIVDFSQIQIDTTKPVL
ncbi:MAG: glycine--tRNA ligase subunit beta [Chlamydiales bacterium]|nr:glycine--tRNA ligase subunit beta [Chlamydiales bacterium]